MSRSEPVAALKLRKQRVVGVFVYKPPISLLVIIRRVKGGVLVFSVSPLGRKEFVLSDDEVVHVYDDPSYMLTALEYVEQLRVIAKRYPNIMPKGR